MKLNANLPVILEWIQKDSRFLYTPQLGKTILPEEFQMQVRQSKNLFY